MEPQETKNASNANATKHQGPKPVKAIGGHGLARVEPDANGSLVLEVTRGDAKAWIGLHPGAALKLAEQLVATARRQLMPKDAAPTGGRVQ